MNISQQLYRMAEFRMAVRPTPLRSMAIFGTNISQGSVATHLRGAGIFYYRFTTNSSARILKIGQHLAKLAAEI